MPQKQEKPYVGCQKISVTLNICPPNYLDKNLLDYVNGVFEWETDKNLFNTKDELKARITAEFTNLNKETVGKRFAGDSEVIWRSLLKLMVIS